MLPAAVHSKQTLHRFLVKLLRLQFKATRSHSYNKTSKYQTHRLMYRHHLFPQATTSSLAKKRSNTETKTAISSTRSRSRPWKAKSASRLDTKLGLAWSMLRVTRLTAPVMLVLHRLTQMLKVLTVRLSLLLSLKLKTIPLFVMMLKPMRARKTLSPDQLLVLLNLQVKATKPLLREI